MKDATRQPYAATAHAGGWPPLGTFAELAVGLSEAADVRETAERVVEFAHDRLGWEMASVLLPDRRTGLVERTAVHGHSLEAADQLQLETRQGPALTIAHAETTDAVVVAEPAADPRWPAWGVHAAQAGVRNLLALQLRTGRRAPSGVLELCSPHRPDACNDVRSARIYASHAAIALENAQALGALRATMDACSMVGRAQGMVMERFGLTAEDALELLQRTSDSLDADLTDVARDLVERHSVRPNPSR